MDGCRERNTPRSGHTMSRVLPHKPATYFENMDFHIDWLLLEPARRPAPPPLTSDQYPDLPRRAREKTLRTRSVRGDAGG